MILCMSLHKYNDLPQQVNVLGLIKHCRFVKCSLNQTLFKTWKNRCTTDADPELEFVFVFVLKGMVGWVGHIVLIYNWPIGIGTGSKTYFARGGGRGNVKIIFIHIINNKSHRYIRMKLFLRFCFVKFTFKKFNGLECTHTPSPRPSMYEKCI